MSVFVFHALTAQSLVAQSTATTSGKDRPEPRQYDIVIYGGTSAGVAAAVQARRMGRSVAMIEPGARLGGLTTGGLGQTDIGNKAAIGGISREFYRAVGRHYADSSAWRWQRQDEYQSRGQSRTSANEDTMWTFEPSVALSIFNAWVKENRIPVIYNERLDRANGVSIDAASRRIQTLTMESGMQVAGKMFIDATYEGDLMASASVSYTVGRESNETYGETLNGVQVAQARSHQIKLGVDPYLIKGDRTSGLLPTIDPTGPYPPDQPHDGAGDHRVQAYCFRMCLTDHPENRIPFDKPDDYQPILYELLFRNFEAGETAIPWSNSAMPNRKTDINNNHGVSTDFIGQNYEYPEASYAQRAEIIARHLQYQRGLMWTLANHPRVPQHVRQEVSRWGLCKDEFIDTHGWPGQLYIREARRMVSDYVMTQHECQGRRIVQDPVGLAAYTMDSHNTQRYVDSQGFVRNEGDVQVGGFAPYPISYRSIIPKQNECQNLLVPVCLSASHIAFGSIRMEPVFMVLGQSASTAAAMAIEQDVALHAVDYSALNAKLKQDGQVLAWRGKRPSPRPIGIKADSLPGIVIDSDVAQTRGFSSSSTSVGPFVGQGYRHDGNTDKGHQQVTFPIAVPEPGRYIVRLGYTAFSNRASRVPVTIQHADGETQVNVNQRKRPSVNDLFEPLGTFRFTNQPGQQVTVSNQGTDGYVVVDALQLIPDRKD